MKNFKKALGSLFLVLERIKGDSRVVEMTIPFSVKPGHLVAKNFAGYEINIYCHRRHLRRIYAKPYVPDKHFILYRVISVVSSDAPLVIRRACELDTEIPSLLPSFVAEESQKMAAISAYLDLVIGRIEDQISQMT